MDELHKQLLENLSYDPEIGLFIWIKRKARNIKIGDVAGYKTTKGYIDISFNGKLYKAHRLAWFYLYKKFPIKDLDHINRNPSDNRINNLREVSSAENAQNKDVRGYSFSKKSNKWRSAIVVNTKKVNLGCFVTEEEAHEAYIKAKRKYHPIWSENV